MSAAQPLAREIDYHAPVAAGGRPAVGRVPTRAPGQDRRAGRQRGEIQGMFARLTGGAHIRPCRLLVAVLGLALGGCSTLANNWLASSGPLRSDVEELRQGDRVSGIRLIDIDAQVAQRLHAAESAQLFSETLRADADRAPYLHQIGPGDVLGISIWEAPPAALFSSAALVAPVATANGTVTALSMNFPNQMVESDGTIKIPFAGAIAVAGKSPLEVDTEIERRLQGSANQPQVLVQIVNNNSANVTVVGVVTNSLRMALTPKGERLLDAIAAAGGVTQPTSKVSVQLTRGKQVCTLPLDTVIQSPSENVRLAPDDVVTLLFQPQYFTVLGATTTNAEVPFEAMGISLVQAMARSGGVIDTRADARGVFLFRFENPAALGEKERAGPSAPDGRIPVIYRLNLRDPASFLLAQEFPMRNHDVIYVANAPAAELQKFLNILTASIYSVNTLINLGQ
jgi:polysaccharide export outer membrane protein